MTPAAGGPEWCWQDHLSEQAQAWRGHQHLTRRWYATLSGGQGMLLWRRNWLNSLPHMLQHLLFRAIVYLLAAVNFPPTLISTACHPPLPPTKTKCMQGCKSCLALPATCCLPPTKNQAPNSPPHHHTHTPHQPQGAKWRSWSTNTSPSTRGRSTARAR